MKKNMGIESNHSLQAILSKENDTNSAESAIVHGAYRIEAGSANRRCTEDGISSTF